MKQLESNKQKHIEYMLKKSQQAQRSFKEQMILGSGLFSDFKKMSSIKSNIKTGKETKQTEYKPTAFKDIDLQQFVEDFEGGKGHCI